jgi:methionyl-tRNA formyltransferase
LEHVLRQTHGIEVLRLREQRELSVERLAAFDPRYVFFPHWSWRIPPVVYDAFECVVFHIADLPFGRGGSPVQNQISLGLEESKLTALRCAAELDAGPIYAKRPLSLLGTAEEIFLRAAEAMEGIIVDLLLHEPQPIPQVGKPVIFKRRRPEDSDLRSAATLKALHDMIRMLDADGYPPAFLDVGPFRFEFTRASRGPDHVAADVRVSLLGDEAK